MTIFDTMRGEIESRFKTAWGDQTPLKFENVPFQQPQAGEWAELTIRGAGGAQIAIGSPGNRLERQTGVVAFRAFTLPNKGTAPALKLCDNAANILRGLQFKSGTTAFRFFSPKPSGESGVAGKPERARQITEPNLLSRTIVVPFEADGFF